MTDAENIEKLAKWLDLPNKTVVYRPDLGDEDNDDAVWWVQEGHMFRPWRPNEEIADAWMLVEKCGDGFAYPEAFSAIRKAWRDETYFLPCHTASEAALTIYNAVLEVIK